MRKLIHSIAILGALFLAACNSSEKPAAAADSTSTQTAKEDYTCPMHLEVKSDKPGSCPICSMDLIKRSEAPKDTVMVDTIVHDHKYE